MARKSSYIASAHKIGRVRIGREDRGSCGTTQRKCNYLSAGLARSDVICHGLAVRKGGSVENPSVRATSLDKNVNPGGCGKIKTYICEVQSWETSLALETRQEREWKYVYGVALAVS
jgi:hypothetical protein